MLDQKAREKTDLEERSIQYLGQLGFPASEARSALVATDYDEQRALARLHAQRQLRMAAPTAMTSLETETCIPVVNMVDYTLVRHLHAGA